MSIIKRARWKDLSGKVTDYDLGANAANVSQDSTHRFVSDTEKNNWNTKLGSTGDGSNLTSKFSQASSRTNLSSGEKDSVSKGKIMKFFADLKAVAFSGSYNDLANKPSIPSGAAASQAVANNCTTTAAGSVLDARQGKVLMDKANQLRSEMASVKQSFQDGCNTLVNKCQSIGITPASNSPTDIANAIQQIRDGSLEAGRQQVTGNPNNYNLFTADQYNNNYNNGYNAGYNAGKAAAKPTCSLVYSQAGSATKDYTYTAPSAGTCLVTLSGVNAGTRYCQKNGSNQSPTRQYDTSGRMLFEYIVPVNAGDRVRAYIQITEDGNWNSGSVSMYFVK